jgi:hypothetical protein
MLAKVFNYAFGAGQTKTFPGGRFLRVLSVSSAVDIEFFDESGTSLGICEGVTTGFAMAFYPQDIGKNAPLVSFGKAQIKSALAQNVQVVISRQPISFDALSGNVTAALTKSSTLSDDADTAIAISATLAIAADANRRNVTISSDPANGDVVRVSKTGGARGHFLQPGMSVTVDCTDGVKVFNPAASAAAVNVGVIYEKD